MIDLKYVSQWARSLSRSYLLQNGPYKVLPRTEEQSVLFGNPTIRKKSGSFSVVDKDGWAINHVDTEVEATWFVEALNLRYAALMISKDTPAFELV